MSSIQLTMLYSLVLPDDIEIIIYNLHEIAAEQLDYTIKNKTYDNIVIVKELFTINIDKNEINIKGYILSDNRWIISPLGQDIKIVFTCSKTDIITGVEYLYHIYCNNMVGNEH